MLDRSLEVDPRRVTQNNVGHVTRQLVARMPVGIRTPNDLSSADWGKVQGHHSSALARFDEVLAIGFDESWAAVCLVLDATGSGAVLGIVRHFATGKQVKPLFADDSYRVVWDGANYGIERTADGVRIGGEFGSEALAIHEIRTRYPSRHGRAA